MTTTRLHASGATVLERCKAEGSFYSGVSYRSREVSENPRRTYFSQTPQAKYEGPAWLEQLMGPCKIPPSKTWWKTRPSDLKFFLLILCDNDYLVYLFPSGHIHLRSC